jgi:hypothetical protein
VDESRARHAAAYDLNRRFFTLNPRDLVIVRVPSRKGKLSLQYIGPCEVLARESDIIYRVKHNKSGREMRVHIDRLRRYRPLVKLTDDDIQASKRLATPTTSSPLVGRRVNAHFGQQGWHHGTVTTVDDDFAHVKFDDGDEHDYTPDEVRRILLPLETDTPTTGAPEQRVEENDMAVLRHRATGVIYVGKVVDTFPDTSEFNFHFYAHQPYKGAKYDVHLPLHERSVRPEYSFNTKGGALRQYATLKPRPTDKPHVYLVDLDEYELLANKFTVNGDGSIPNDVIRRIPGAAALPAKKRRKVT